MKSKKDNGERTFLKGILVPQIELELEEIDKARIITTYISAWAWHIIALLFFLKMLDFLMIHNYVWMFGFAGIFFFAEVMAWSRKINVEKMVK